MLKNPYNIMNDNRAYMGYLRGIYDAKKQIEELRVNDIEKIDSDFMLGFNHGLDCINAKIEVDDAGYRRFLNEE